MAVVERVVSLFLLSAASASGRAAAAASKVCYDYDYIWPYRGTLGSQREGRLVGF